LLLTLMVGAFFIVLIDKREVKMKYKGGCRRLAAATQKAM